MVKKEKPDKSALAYKEVAFQNQEGNERASVTYDDLRKSKEQLVKIKRLYAFISQVNQNIVRVKDQETLFHNACKMALEFGKFKMAWIGLFSKDNQEITLADQCGIPDDKIELFSHIIWQKNGPQDQVLHAQKYYLCNDIEHDFELDSWKPFAIEHGIRSLMVLPIKKGGNIIGTFNLYSSELNFSGEEEIKLLIEVTGDISYALDMFEKEKRQKETEELLTHREKRFRALIEKGSDFIALGNIDGRFSYVGPSVVAVLGYSEEELLNMSGFDLIHPDDLPAVIEETQRIAKIPGSFYSRQQRFLHKNGTWIWGEGTVTNMLDEPGINSLVSNFRDITERKTAEEQKEFDSNNLNALINNTKDLMWSVDRDFNLIISNIPFDEAGKVNFGKAVVKGENVLAVAYTPEMLSHFKELYERAFSGESFTEIEHFSFPFEFWTEISYHPIRKGDKVIGTACHSRFITDLKKAEQSLIASSIELQNALNDLNKIMDSSLDIICVVNSEGLFVMVSAACQTVWGYTPDELIGKPLIDFVYAEDRQRTKEEAQRVMAGVNASGFENRYIRKDGSLVEMSWSVRWDVGDQERYGVARDITQKKALQKALDIERQRFYDLFIEAPSSMGMLSGPNHVFEIVNPLYLELIGKNDIIGKTVKEVLPEIVEQGFVEILDKVYETGHSFSANEMLIKLDRSGDGKFVDRYLNFMYQAHRNNEDIIDGIFFFAVDVTEQVLLRKEIEQNESRLKEAQSIAHLGHWKLSFATHVAIWSDEACRIYGLAVEDNHQTYAAWISFIHPDDLEQVLADIKASQATLSDGDLKHRILLKDGTVKYIHSISKFEFDENGNPIGLYGVAHDITDQKLSELAINESNERYKMATMATSDIVWDWNILTDTVYRSENYFEQLGYPPSAENIYDESWIHNIHPDDKQQTLISMLEKVNSPNGSIWESEYRFYLSNGEMIYIKDKGHIVRDATGKAIRMVGAMSNITNQKLGEENLRNSEAHLAEAQRLAKMGSWDYDVEANKLVWSDALYTVFDTDKLTFMETHGSFLNLIDEEDREFAMKTSRHTQKTGEPFTIEYNITTLKGEKRVIQEHGYGKMDTNGKVIRLFGTAQNITERKQADEEVQKLATIVQNSSEFIGIATLDATVIYLNDGGKIIVGLKDAVTSYTMFDFFAPQDLKLFQEKVIPAVQKMGRWRGEIHLRHFETGERIPVQMDIFYVYGPKTKSPIAFATVTTNLSERKRNQDQLELQNAELSKTNSELDRFVYSVSHDLRAPLTSVLGLTYFIEQESKETAILKYAEMIRTSVTRLDDYIKNILNYSKNNRLELMVAEIPLQKTVDEIVAYLCNLKGGQGIKFEIDLDESVPFYSDQIRLNTILENLIANAIKYHSEKQSGRWVKIKGITTGDNLEITIADNGIGIDAKYHKAIFDMFFRLPGKAAGTGIGLYIVKEMIEKLQGTIQIKSEEGKGTTFIITIKNMQP